LRASPDDVLVVRAMLSKADEIHFKYQKRQAVLIGNEIARILKRMLG
jgi:hypothetical protein